VAQFNQPSSLVPPREAGLLPRLCHGAPPASELSNLRACYVLSVIVLVSVINLMDRQLLSILLVPIQQELNATDTQMGLLTGFAFALFYSVAGIPLALWADRRNRRNLVASVLTIWSMATAASGFVTSYFQLLVARVFVASGEAGSGPANLSIIADLFPLNRRATAIGINLIGASTGVFLGMYLGGLLAEHYGWRATFVIFGIPGLIVASLYWLTVPEPRRGAMDGGALPDADSANVRAALRYLFGLPTFRLLIIGASLHSIVNGAWMTWSPAFLIRVHEFSVAEAGLWLGIVGGIGTGVGNLAGGFLSDWMGKRDARWYLLIPAAALAVAAPTYTLFLFLPDTSGVLSAFVPFGFCVAIAFGPAVAVGLTLAKPHMRGLQSAVYSFCTQLIGFTVGPLLIGALNDVLRSTYGDVAIRYSMAAVPIVAVLAALVFAAASRTFKGDLARAQPPR
jgi:predicted MFS family arabinose efflux permease